MTFFDERGQQILGPEWLKKYAAYYFLDGPTWKGVNRRNQSSYFVEDRVCSLLDQTTFLTVNDLVILMAWKMGMIDHSSSEKLRKLIYAHNFDTTLISKSQYGLRNFSKSIPYLAMNMPTITRSLREHPAYLVDRIRGSHPELEGFGITYILTVQFFVTHGTYPIYDKFAHIGAAALHQGLKPGSPIKYKPIQDWSEYQGYINLLKPISAASLSSGSSPSMTVPRPVDRALWVYGHFFQEPKPMQNRQALASTPVNQLANGGQSFKGTTHIRCSVDSMSQKYADGRTRVVLAVRPECTKQLPTIRIGERRMITLSTPVGDFEAYIRAWSSTSDRPYICPNLFSKAIQQKETLAKVLENCHISIGSIVKIAVAGDTWKIAQAAQDQ